MFKIDSKLYPVFAGVLILGMIFGYFLARSYAYQLGVEKGKQETEEKYQTKIEEIFPPMIEQDEIFSVFGEIKQIKDRTLVLEQIVYPSNPFEDPETKQWQVAVAEATELVKNVGKTPEELEQEMAVSQEPATVVKEVAIEFSELQVGQNISVVARENIKNKTEFEAQKIILTIKLVP